MFKYAVIPRDYDCHPETCTHTDHSKYWVVQIAPLNGSSVRYFVNKWIKGFDDVQEAQRYLVANFK